MYRVSQRKPTTWGQFPINGQKKKHAKVHYLTNQMKQEIKFHQMGD